ncbi:MAG: hypothetical protein IH624_20145 [Phycisphaerae bacterium]|nr:hypothetical protein [Phycisphaerae bacterium]
MPDKKENLETVLGDLLGAHEAHQAAEDIRSGDCLLRQYPAPKPGAALLADINIQIARALLARRRRTIHWVGRAIAAAAAVIVVGSVLLFFSGDAPVHVAGPIPGPGAPPAPDWWDDKAVEKLTAEVDDVYQTLMSMSDTTYTQDKTWDFETELKDLEMVAMNDDFWKG